MTDWSECTQNDETYAELKRRIAAEQTDHYRIECGSEDYKVLAEAWNMGIDSHLEALTERSSLSSPFSKAVFHIHPEELPVLVRRLFKIAEGEDHEDEDGPALGLATGILYTLNIEVDCG